MRTGNILFWFLGAGCILAAMVVTVGMMNALYTGGLSPESSDLWLAVCVALGLVMVGGWMWIGTAVGIAEDAGEEPEVPDDDTPGGPPL